MTTRDLLGYIFYAYALTLGFVGAWLLVDKQPWLSLASLAIAWTAIIGAERWRGWYEEDKDKD